AASFASGLWATTKVAAIALRGDSCLVNLFMLKTKRYLEEALETLQSIKCEHHKNCLDDDSNTNSRHLAKNIQENGY
ncbi:hypothetical protein CU097_003281, partial [Rhizopus azygosporus]